jgi:hypothetical protein
MGPLAFVFILGSAAKADPVNMTCATDPLTSSIVVFTTGADVTVRVIHHNGTDYLPLASSNITPHDLPALAQKAKILQQLGAQYDLHLKSNQCTINSQKLVSCYGETNQTLNGHKLSYFTFDTSSVSTLSTLYPDPNLNTVANLTITVDGTDYAFGVGYSPKDCIDTSGIRRLLN